MMRASRLLNAERNINIQIYGVNRNNFSIKLKFSLRKIISNPYLKQLYKK